MVPSPAATSPHARLTWRGPLLRTGPDLTAYDLLLVLLLALLLRVAGLGAAPLWSDETATAAFASLPWAELFGGIGRLEPNPPGFYGLEKLWTGLAGDDPFALRAPAALFGLAGVAAVWALAREAFGPRPALLAALLLATSPQHLDVSREARGYALLFLLLAAAMVMARRIATAAPHHSLPRPAAILAALGGGAIWVHHTGVIALAAALAAAGVIALHPRRTAPPVRRLAALALAGLGALALGAPSLYAMVTIAADSANNAAWIPAPDALFGTAMVVGALAAPLAGLRSLPVGLGLLGFALGAGLVLATLAHAAWHARRDPTRAGMLAGFVTGTILMASVSQVRPIMVEHTLLFLLIFFLPLLGATLAAAPTPGRVALLAALALSGAPAAVTLAAPTRHGEDWPSAAMMVSRLSNTRNWPVIVSGGFDALSLDRMLTDSDPARPTIAITPPIGGRLNDEVAQSLTSAQPLAPGTPPNQLCAALHAHSGVVLVLHHSVTLATWRPQVAAMLGAAGGHPDGSTRFGSIEVERWPGVCSHIRPPP